MDDDQEIIGIESIPPSDLDNGQNMPGNNMENASFPTSNKMPLAGQLLMATVLLLQITLEDVEVEPENRSFCIVASIVSLTFVTSSIILTMMKPDLKEKIIYSAQMLGEVSVGYAIDMFLFFWWSITTGIVTFDGPFIELGNGYFASWGGFIFSIIGLGVSLDKLQSAVKGLGNLLGLGVCSVVVIFALTPEFGTKYQSEALYAFIIAMITVVFIGIVFYTKREETLFAFFVLSLLSCLWIVLAFIVTFRGPFYDTGNGYFGSWGGAILSLMAAFEIRQVDRLPRFVQNAVSGAV